MRKVIAAGVGLAVLSSGLGGCSTAGLGGGGRTTVGTLETTVPGPGAATPAIGGVAPAPVVSMGPLLEGPIGSRLAASEREVAFKAEVQALTTGERKTWRGEKGTYGFVVPAATDGSAGVGAPGGECRAFTHTIYFAGRPQTGRGSGCRDPDGSWRITG